ncbi:predicted protein [Naegleria gruberi]|uniref:Predicted protein n=1 Tax=Naegleria gruberi TaxID=5762 RepID=D2VNB0_NAEGR|nr:uncharacterized protein NAEGRDRAFT_70432 [Naegleria gruberi]EFC41621.1 predicted protein [Naegleria gruberi]|eukprot:XP_002674365.1 predicted protein [Naegleria gruberi strain NEG-M]
MRSLLCGKVINRNFSIPSSAASCGVGLLLGRKLLTTTIPHQVILSNCSSCLKQVSLINPNENHHRQFFFKKSSNSIIPKDGEKEEDYNKFTSSFYVKALAPLIAALVYWYLKDWESKKVKVDFDALKKYLETYQDQIREQAFLAALESLSHQEHRELMNDVISQSSENGKYLVGVSNSENINHFDLEIQVMSDMKTYKPHTLVDGQVKYALFGELWHVEEKNPSTLQAYGKKCFDSRDITLNIHCPVRILAKPANGAVLGHLGDKPLCYLVANIQMKCVEKDFIPAKRPELTISKISIAPITSHFSTILV